MWYPTVHFRLSVGLFLWAWCSFLYAQAGDWIAAPGANPCDGYYEYDPKLDALPPYYRKGPIHIIADQVTVAPAGEVSLQGEVKISQGSQTLTAHQAILTQDPTTHKITHFEAKQGITLSRPGLTLRGEHVWLDYAERTLHMGPQSFHLYSRLVRGESQALILQEDGTLQLTDACYTTCAPHFNTWQLAAQTVTLTPQAGKGYATGATLQMWDVPVFYLPYLEFPIDDRRMSGFLFPSIGTKEGNGWIVAVPYYFNIAANHDLLLTPRLRTERGMEIESTWRYLTELHTGTLQASLLPYDKAHLRKRAEFSAAAEGLSPTDKRVAALLTHKHRAGVVWHHSGQLSQNTSLQFNVNWVADDNHFQDLGHVLEVNNVTHLLSQALFSYHPSDWNADILFQSFQTLNPLLGPLNEGEYRRLPMVTLTRTEPWRWNILHSTVSTDFAHFVFPGKRLDGTVATTGMRHHALLELGAPITPRHWFFIPQVDVDIAHYDLRLGDTNQRFHDPAQFTRVLPLFHLDMGTILERKILIKEMPWIQTLEPRLYYLYVPFAPQDHIPLFDTSRTTFVTDQFFRPNRFSGIDRIGDANHLSFLVRSRFLHGLQWEDKLSLTVGTITYFRARKVSLCDGRVAPECRDLEDPRRHGKHSPLIAELLLTPTSLWHVRSNFEWYSTLLDSAGFTFGYHAPHGVNFELSYNHIINPYPLLPAPNLALARPGTLEQTEMSFVIPVGTSWQWVGRWMQDWREHTLLEGLAGIEYSGCCIAWQFAFTRAAQPTDLGRPQRYSHTLSLQFRLKGLGSVGNPVGSRLQTHIPGYKPLPL